MAFDVYQLSDQQIELAFLASDNGKLFGKDNKFIRLSKEDFRNYPYGDGRAILREGLRSNMVRKTKSGGYALFARHVQQIVSVHNRPDSMYLSGNSEDVDDLEAFDNLEDENYVEASKKNDQPVLTYMGSGLAILALLLSSFISSSGLVGIFTVLLSIAGFILSFVGTILFFKSVGTNTPKSSKIMHVILTLISLVSVVLLTSQTFFMAPSDVNVNLSGESTIETVDSNKGDVMANVTGELEGGYVELSQEQLRETVSFEYGMFEIRIEEGSLLKTGLPIRVTNTSDEQRVYNLVVEAYNVNGEKIGLSDELLLADIEPGETYEGVLFEYMLPSDAETLAQEGITFALDHISTN